SVATSVATAIFSCELPAMRSPPLTLSDRLLDSGLLRSQSLTATILLTDIKGHSSVSGLFTEGKIVHCFPAYLVS
ncbi:MAG TPA: hypothetical protein DCL61_11010, partial [Cyanobacteria bacterium UBA12227]|nr:hypothetical protein [Cyanobacteria bacterium UBA12227]HBY76117.1 hypothetical protein [Cyanobacteria bacterium UBA11148]